MKKLFLIITCVIALIALPILANAASVKVNYLSCDGSHMASGQYVSKNRNTTVYFESQIAYDAGGIGPIEFPATGYLEFNIPYLPFKKPTTTGGHDPNMTFSYAYSPAYGDSCWYGSTSFSMSGETSAKQGCKADTEGFGTSYAVCKSGTGSGHDLDDNFSFNIKVN